MGSDTMAAALQNREISYTLDKGWVCGSRRMRRDRVSEYLRTSCADATGAQIEEYLTEREATAKPPQAQRDAGQGLYNATMSHLFQAFRWALDGGKPRIYVRTRFDALEVREIIAPATELHRHLRDAVMSLGPSNPQWYQELMLGIDATHKTVTVKHGRTVEAWVKAGLAGGRLHEDIGALMSLPQAMSTSRTEPCLFFVDKKKIVRGPHPTWDVFEKKMTADEVKVFRAYVAGIFDPNNRGRQGLWLKGEGGSGKSAVITAIHDSLEGAAAAVSPAALSNQFWASKIYGKRLVVYADCNYPRFLTDGKFHSVLGGDPVDVEHKHRASETHKVHCKVIVGSNYLPEINLEADDERSRVIMLLVGKGPDTKHLSADGKLLGDDGYEKGLRAEFWHYLHTCIGVYKEMCPTGQNILLPESVERQMNALCGSSDDGIFATMAHQCLEFDDSAEPIDASVFQRWLGQQVPDIARDNNRRGRLLQYLERHHNVRRRRVGGRYARVTYLYGMRVLRDMPRIKTKPSIIRPEDDDEN